MSICLDFQSYKTRNKKRQSKIFSNNRSLITILFFFFFFLAQTHSTTLKVHQQAGRKGQSGGHSASFRTDHRNTAATFTPSFQLSVASAHVLLQLLLQAGNVRLLPSQCLLQLTDFLSTGRRKCSSQVRRLLQRKNSEN